MHGVGQLEQWFASFERLQDRLQEKDSGNAHMLSKHLGTSSVTIFVDHHHFGRQGVIFGVSQKFGSIGGGQQCVLIAHTVKTLAA